MYIFLQLLLLILGFVMLVKGADWFVDGAVGIAEKFKIPSLVIGLTIVAMGTSAPEAAISITAAAKGSAAISIGNVVGSNIMNILVILGLAAVIVPLAVQKSTQKYEMPFVLVITAALLWMGWDGYVSRIDGVILWIFFLLYLYYMYRIAKQGMAAEKASTEGSFAIAGGTSNGFAVSTTSTALAAEQKVMNIWKAIFLTVLGIVLIVWGSDITVDAATNIAKALGVSDRIIGLTIVALGTSLPELFTSVNAARKGNADIAVGNIIGSCVFNILFVIGTSALIIPIGFNPDFRIDTVVAIGAALLLWLLSFNKDRQIKRWGGATLLAGYVGYFVYLMLK